MIETIAIVCGIIGGLAGLGGTTYKCYQTYKERQTPQVVINQHQCDRNEHVDHKSVDKTQHLGHRGDMPISSMDELVLNGLKKKHRRNDSDTSVEIKINIHTPEDEGSE